MFEFLGTKSAVKRSNFRMLPTKSNNSSSAQGVAIVPSVRGGAAQPSASQGYVSIAKSKARPAKRMIAVRCTKTIIGSETIGVGDQLGAIGTTLSPRPTGNVTFSGSFGATTNTVMEKMSQSNPFQIGGVRCEVSATATFTTGSIKFIFGDYDGTTEISPLQVQQAKRPANFDQTQLYFENINVTFDGFTSLVFTLAAVNEFIEFDIECDFVSLVYNMKM